jgi:GNAT superfamily N-acetyltransferase
MRTAHVHYPLHLIDAVRLGEGAPVSVRPILQQDAELLEAFVRDLSAEARYNRFLSPIRELPPRLLEKLTQIDHAKHVALVATEFADGREVAIGEARYARDGADDAEFAIAVADAWQGRGLARLLLQKLEAAAADAGVRRLVGDTLRGNDRMLRFVRRAGYAIKPGGTAWQLRLEKTLDRRALAA